MSRKTETIVVQSPALGTKEHLYLILAGDYPDGKLAVEAHHSREGVVCVEGEGLTYLDGVRQRVMKICRHRLKRDPSPAHSTVSGISLARGRDGCNSTHDKCRRQKKWSQ